MNLKSSPNSCNRFVIAVKSTRTDMHARFFKVAPAMFLLVICATATKKKPRGVYAIKMPPMVATRRRNDAKVDPVPVSCSSKNVTRAFSDLRKKIQCVPRDTVVDVAAPDGSTVSPNTVVVKRCGGMCSGGKKCMSSKKNPVEFYVRTTSSRSDMVFCNSIIVMEDTECKCKCTKKKKSCLPGQKFDSTTCNCYCPKTEEYNECMDKDDLNFKWDPSSCSCVCKHEKKCTTGTVWNPSKCRCAKTR